MKTITLEIEDIDWKAMEHDLLDPETWILEALRGKINSCSKRIVATETSRLLADPEIESLPGTREGLLESHFAQPSYKNRTQREAEELAALLGEESGGS